MAKPRQKFPKVFLACPFKPAKDRDRLEEYLRALPWNLDVADQNLTNNDLLGKIAKQISTCDFAVFDVTGWNANVCLELGLAIGMKKDYYIIHNSKFKPDVPSDIRGKDRIEYNWNTSKNAKNIFDEFQKKLFKHQYLSAKIWNHVKQEYRADDIFGNSLVLLSKLKKNGDRLNKSEQKDCRWGFQLKKVSDQEAAITALAELGIIRKIQKNGEIELIRSIY